MKGEELGKLMLDGLLVSKNGFLVAHYCVHVCLEQVHVLAVGDLVFMGLNPSTHQIELSGHGPGPLV